MRASKLLAVVATLVLLPLSVPLAGADTLFGSYEDEFDNPSYTGSNGSHPWTDPWVETSDDGSPAAGLIYAGSEPHCFEVLCLVVGKDTGDDAAVISRRADLSSADSAWLSYMYKRHKHGGGGGTVEVQVSSTGTGGWTTLRTFDLTDTDGSALPAGHDVTAWISTTTTIRFNLTGNVDDSHINFDRIRIELYEDDNVAPELDPIIDATIDEQVPYGFTATASDANGGQTLTFTLDGSEPSGAAMTTGGAFTWTPSESQGPGVYAFDVIVTDNGSPPMDDRQTVTLTVQETNSAPTLDPVGNHAVTEGSTLAFTATGSDFDPGAGGDLSYRLSGGVPSGASMSSGGSFSWEPTESQGPGVYTFDVVVEDDGVPQLSDFETIQVTVSEHNQAPTLDTIGDRNVDEGSLLSFTATATDPDDPANSLTYGLVGAPSGATITAGGTFSWTPTDAQGPGSYDFDVVVTDDGSPSKDDSETITVTVAESNIAPVITPPGTRHVTEGSKLTVDIVASDPDTPSNTITFSLSGAPPGASITPAGRFTWTPTEAQGPDTYTMTVTATDDGSPAAAASAPLTVIVAESNTAPQIDPIAPIAGDEGAPINFTATASDDDVPSNTLTFSLIGAPSGASISSGGVFSWTPSESQGPGVHTFTVEVSDNASPAKKDSTTVSITVAEANNGPVFDPVGSQRVAELDTLEFTVTAIDTDVPPNDVRFSLVSGPAGATITSAGVFRWTPTEEHGPDVHSVRIRATDDGSPARSTDVTVAITVEEVNQPPTLTVESSHIVEAGSPFELALTATDPDLPAQQLTFSATGLPDGANLTDDGVFTWTAAATAIGTSHVVTLTVTDDGPAELTASAATTLEVVSRNEPPVLGPDRSFEIVLGDSVHFTAVATDPDADPGEISYALRDAPSGATIDSTTGEFGWTPDAGQNNTLHRFAVVATDQGTPQKSDEMAVTVLVGSLNAPPTIADIDDRLSRPAEVVDFTFEVSDTDGPEPVTVEVIGLPDGLAATKNRTAGVISVQGEVAFAALDASPHLVEIVATDGEHTTTVQFTWYVEPVQPTAVATPVRKAVVDATTGGPDETLVEREPSAVRRNLVVLSRRAREGAKQLSLPVLLLALSGLAAFTLGRVGLFPLVHRGVRQRGRITALDPDTGTGLILRDDDQQEVFIHTQAIPGRFRKRVGVGDRVMFSAVDGAYRDLVTRVVPEPAT